MGRVSDAKERIVQSAKTLIASRGYACVGVQELCEHAGVKKGSFYHFFDSKRDVVLAVIERYGEWFDEVLRDALAPDVAPPARIDRLLETLYRLHRSRAKDCGQAEGCMVGNLAAELSTHDETVRKRLQATFERWAGAIEATLREAAEAGQLQSVDPATTALALVGYIEGATMLAKTCNDAAVLRRLKPAALRLVGFKTRETRARGKPSCKRV
jgi:TetR/AcrR family transcriptional repressor of nem operon